MMTRRRVIAIGMTAPMWAGVSRLLASASAQFWNERPAAEWSEKDVEQLLNRSPWAKESEAHFRMPGGDGSPSDGPGGGGGMGGPGGGGPGGGGGMGGPPGGGMGGPPGGGMGGPPGGGGMGGPPGGGMPQLKATVRWESAAPIVEARKLHPDPEAAANYIISVTGLPLFGGGPPPGRGPGGAPPGREAGSTAGGERPERPVPTAEQRKAMIAGLTQSTALQRKGKDPIAAARVGELEGSETPTLLFYFPRTGNPVTLADKEVTFLTRLGPIQLKVKFSLKDMQYHGQLSL